MTVTIRAKHYENIFKFNKVLHKILFLQMLCMHWIMHGKIIHLILARTF